MNDIFSSFQDYNFGIIDFLTNFIFSGGFLIFVIFVLVISVVFIFLRNFFLRKGFFSDSLGLSVINVQFPKNNQNKDQKEKMGLAEIREKISIMEQVFSQFITIKRGGFKGFLYGEPFFSMEVVVQNSGQQIEFFVLIPKKYEKSISKSIQGIYPEAILNNVRGYKMFKAGSMVSGAMITAKNKFLPIKTYNGMEIDPLSVLLNNFSKIQKENESLAIQIIGRYSKGYYNKRLSDVAKNVKSGKGLREAMSKNKKKDEVGDLGVNTYFDEGLVNALKTKSQKQIFESTLRILSSAQTQERADALIDEFSSYFSQFNLEEVNRLNVKKIQKNKLKKFVYDFVFRAPVKKSSATYVSTEELSSLIHFPNNIFHALLSASKAKQSSAPLNIAESGILLGKNIFRGEEKNIYMKDDDRARHLYVIGQTGTGKTSFLKNLVIQDINSGKGVCFIDPHGDAVEDILSKIPKERAKDVIYFNPSDTERPLALNMLEYDEKLPEQKTFVINELLEIFNKLYDMKTVGGPMFEQYFRNATSLVMDSPELGNTLLEINLVFADKKFREMKLEKCKNQLVKLFWKEIAEKAGGEASLQNMIPYISSKFDSFLSNDIMRPIVLQEKSSFNFREVMDSGKILLVNLSKGKLGELNSALIGLIIVGKIALAAFSRSNIQEGDRKPFYLYIDEFQNVTTNSIEKILSEARKYKLNLIIANQFVGQLSENISKAVFGNVGSKIAFRVGADDGDLLEKEFTPEFTANDLMNIDNFNCYARILIDGQTAPAFSLKITDPVRSGSGISEKIKELSRVVYGSPRGEIERMIDDKFLKLHSKAIIK